MKGLGGRLTGAGGGGAGDLGIELLEGGFEGGGGDFGMFDFGVAGRNAASCRPSCWCCY